MFAPPLHCVYSAEYIQRQEIKYLLSHGFRYYLSVIFVKGWLDKYCHNSKLPMFFLNDLF
jgi:hypothetical protein